MPMYDRICSGCGAVQVDCYEPVSYTDPLCAACGSLTERAWLAAPPNIIDDSIPGGIEIRHGLVNPDGSPMTFYSKSEIQREAKRRGLINQVEHVTEPGTDKAKHTTRWI